MKQLIECSIDDIMGLSYLEIVDLVYDSIPLYEGLLDENLDNERVKYLLLYYPTIYHKLSKIYSMMQDMANYRNKNKEYLIKAAIEQAHKVIKFSYDTLSRRITIEKEEHSLY